MSATFDFRGKRIDEGMTQGELAEKLGIDRGTVIRIERGQRPLPSTATKVAEWAGKQPSELWPTLETAA